MSRNYKFHDQEQIYFISFATVYWVDVFIRPIYKNILVESIQYCIEAKGLLVYVWVIMTSHVHMIIGTRQVKMQDIVRDLKKFSSKKIIEAIQNNPVVEGFVNETYEYKYSSAIDYSGGKGLINVEIID
ncbi:MAG: transposase [Bacteroidetes bacterium]|jgi:putative transposase|nr:transposase [Bacteroidota bacterium]MBT5530276.1 transposase [Cytophagia bacterium]MBT3934626.1 transposase [Bacteroidota bacterium]MBT4728503.1 transposase [Bacteroidota bacterium]MBT4969209.1 transposase [Bacteroidota bacterium]